MTAILEHLSSLSDGTRSRLLLLLEGRELTVSEMCAVLQLPQSTVSRHLKTLVDGGWVTSRREATSRYYTMQALGDEPSLRRLWRVVREQVAALPAAAEDEIRLKAVLEARRTRSQTFFSTAAGQWDRMREELFGRHVHLLALLGLLDPDTTIGDLGCGTGQVSEALSPFVKQIIAVDESKAMLDAARARLGKHGNVELRRGTLESLPLEDDELDAATAFLVLHHLPHPRLALAEVARVLKPGGRLLILDMLPHDRQEYRRQMGHVWLGFEESQVRQDLKDAGFSNIGFQPLPPDPEAKGPRLFVASAVCAKRAST